MPIGSEVPARPFPKVTTGVATLVSDCLLLQYNWRLLRRYRLRAHRCLPSLFEAKRLVLCLVWLVSYFLHIRLDKHEIELRLPILWTRGVEVHLYPASNNAIAYQFGPFPVAGSCGDAVPWPAMVRQNPPTRKVFPG